MPTLPRIDTAQSVFNDVALGSQNIQAGPENFGGQVAQAVGGLGQAGERAGGNVLDVGLMYKGIHDETDANSSYTGYADDSRGVTDKLKSLSGKAAVDFAPIAAQQVEAIRQKYRDNLSDPQAKRMYDQVSTRHFQGTLDLISNIKDVNQKTYEDQTSDGMVNNFQQSAAQVWNDPGAFNSQLANIAVERQ